MSNTGYSRNPSDELRALLKRGGILAPLTDKDLRASQPNVSLDIHFRPIEHRKI